MDVLPRFIGGEIDEIPTDGRLVAQGFLLEFGFCKVPLTLYTCIVIVFQVWEEFYLNLAPLRSPPFSCHLEIASKKGMICLRFLRFFLMGNGYETLDIS